MDETRRLAEYAQLAEQLGFDFVWIPDVDLEREVFVVSTYVASRTSRISIGVIANPYTREPAISAAAAATLDEVSEGRVVYTLCAGGYRSLHPFGFRSWEKPLASIRRAVEVTRSLFHGETRVLDYTQPRRPEIGLAFQARREIPIYIAAMTGFRMMELAGGIADGVLLAGPLGLSFTKLCLGKVLKGAVEAGRDPKKLGMGLQALFSVSYDDMAAREGVKKMVATMIIADPRFRRAHKAAGISDEEIDMVKKVVSGGGERITEAVTDRMLDYFSISGSPERCAEKIRRYAELGLTEICLMIPPEADVRETIRIVAEDLMPRLK